MTRPPMRCRCTWNTVCPASLFVLKTVRNPPADSPRSFAIAAARLTSSPTIASSPAARALSDGMWRLGTTSTCVGACGLMSLNAHTRSSSYTIDAGISRPMMRQKRQSAMVAAILAPLGDGRPRDAVQVALERAQHQRAAVPDEAFDVHVLSEPEFENEVRAGSEASGRLIDETRHGVQPVGTTVQRDFGLLAHFGLQSVTIDRADVRRVRDDQIEWTAGRLQQIGLRERDAHTRAVPRGVAARHGQRRVRNVRGQDR